jgi:cyd operon protein YbgT
MSAKTATWHIDPEERQVWDFAWVPGIGFAVLLAILHAIWHEDRKAIANACGPKARPTGRQAVRGPERKRGGAMKSMRRTNFIVAANIVWLALFAAEIFAVLAPDYMAWWQHVGARSLRSCDEDTVRYNLADRMFLFGLIWLFSAPVMSLIALRIPAQWPAQLSQLWWNRTAPARSFVTAAVALVLMLWPLIGMVNAPVASMFVIEAARAVLLLGVLLYYRAVVLSA